MGVGGWGGAGVLGQTFLVSPVLGVGWGDGGEPGSQAEPILVFARFARVGWGVLVSARLWWWGEFEVVHLFPMYNFRSTVFGLSMSNSPTQKLNMSIVFQLLTFATQIGLGLKWNKDRPFGKIYSCMTDSRSAFVSFAACF